MQIRTDDAHLHDLLAFQYRHFLAKPPFRPHRRIVLKLHTARPSLSAGGRRLALPRGSSSSHGLSLVTEGLLDSLPGYLIFHAGVVSWQGRGLLICGPPGFGKTSLVLEMARRGCGFLSDDYAPISLRDGKVHPFPRSVAIVAGPDGTRQLRGIGRDLRRRFGAKDLVSPSDLRGMAASGSCTPAAVCLLGPRTPGRNTAVLRYDVVLQSGWAASLREHLPGAVLRKKREAPPGAERFRLQIRAGSMLSSRLHDWSDRHRGVVFSLERVHRRAGAFQGPLQAHTVPARDGLIEILSDLHNRRPGSAALGRVKISPGPLLLAAARLLGGVRFIRLQGGTPSQRADAALESLRHGGDRA